MLIKRENLCKEKQTKPDSRSKRRENLKRSSVRGRKKPKHGVFNRWNISIIDSKCDFLLPDNSRGFITVFPKSKAFSVTFFANAKPFFALVSQSDKFSKLAQSSFQVASFDSPEFPSSVVDIKKKAQLRSITLGATVFRSLTRCESTACVRPETRRAKKYKNIKLRKRFTAPKTEKIL